MTSTPKIDVRTYQDLVRQTESLAQQYSGWQPGQEDLGAALIHLFAGMAEEVVQQLNRAPEKHFLAFLDLLGVQPLPPRPARAPVTFVAAVGTREPVDVAAGTRVAGTPATGNEPVIFETEQPLVLTPAQLVSAFVRDLERQRWADLTGAVTGHDPPVEVSSIEPPPGWASDPGAGVRGDGAAVPPSETFAAFAGDTKVGHLLFFSFDGLLKRPSGRRSLALILEWSATPALEWILRDRDGWKSVGVSSDGSRISYSPALASAVELWARPPAGSLTEKPPTLETVGMEIEVQGERLTDAFAGDLALDLSKDFRPFGDQPEAGAAFYLACPDTVDKGEKITVKWTSTPNVTVETAAGKPEIVWEVYGSDGDIVKWYKVAKPNFQPEALTKDGSTDLELPVGMVAHEIRGVRSHWLRARITGGMYGTPATTKDVQQVLERDSKEETVTIKDVPFPARYTPPSLASVELHYTARVTGPPPKVKSRYEPRWTDHTAALGQGQPVVPLVPWEDAEPTLYLGFEDHFANREVTLYAGVETEPWTGGDAGSASVAWDYSAEGGGWKSLAIDDSTGGFRESGVLRFRGPEDQGRRELDGRELFWLRARWLVASGTPPVPRLRRLVPNTTWASQALTIDDEVLGSGTGAPDQVFHTLHTPVLEDPWITVRELDRPLADDVVTLRAAAGDEMVTVDHDAGGGAEEVWVRWQQVPDFHASGPGDRHFTLDHESGEIRFGDRRHGMAPPPGRGNVRARRYRTGGGASGNLPAGAITQLTAALPSVAAVTNPEPASGGADRESEQRFRRRGPTILRHRGKAVAAQDFEDLAREASSEVARIRCLAAGAQVGGRELAAGRVEVIVVPASEDQPPVPSRGLIQRVEGYLRQRASPTLEVTVRGPEWLEIAVTATLVPRHDAPSGLAQTAEDALTHFLHPLHGGRDHHGWDFGRVPHASDLIALLEGIAGVDHVAELTLPPSAPPEPERTLIVSADHHPISLRSRQEES